jgi:hypothetical protein
VPLLSTGLFTLAILGRLSTSTNEEEERQPHPRILVHVGGVQEVSLEHALRHRQHRFERRAHSF